MSTDAMPFSAVMLGSVSFVFLNFLLPIYATEIGATATQVGGMFTAFTIVMLVLRPIVGWALDRFGRRAFFIAAFLFYTLAMTVFSQLETLVDFYIARALQGVGASLMWVSARTIIADVYVEENRAEFMGRLAAKSVRGSMYGAFFGFTLLGFLPVAVAWQFAFAGYAVAAFVGFLLALRGAPRRQPVLSRQRYQFAALRSTNITRVMVIVFLAGFASALIEPIYLIFLKEKFDLHIMWLALAFFPSGIVFAILPQYAGRWADRFGRHTMIAAGIAIAGVVSSTLPLMPHILVIAVLYVLLAVGWCFADPALDATVAAIADEQTRGTVFGIKESADSFGAALGPLAGGYLYDVGSMELPFIANGMLLLCAALLSWWWLKPPASV